MKITTDNGGRRDTTDPRYTGDPHRARGSPYMAELANSHWLFGSEAAEEPAKIAAKPIPLLFGGRVRPVSFGQLPLTGHLRYYWTCLGQAAIAYSHHDESKQGHTEYLEIVD